MNNTAQNHSLAIILPCYNPKPGWQEEVVQEVQLFLQKVALTNVPIVVVNDGSESGVSDDHIVYLQSKFDQLHYISLPQNKGKGAALRTGVDAVEAENYLYTDVDFPYTIESLVRVYQTLKVGDADVVVAVRDENYYKQVPLLRKVISRVLKFLIRNLFSMSITDTQGGLKAFNYRGKSIFLSTTIDRYLFDLEFIYLASNTKEMKLEPVQVQLKGGVSFSKMGWNVLFKEGLNFLKILFSRK